LIWLETIRNKWLFIKGKTQIKAELQTTIEKKREEQLAQIQRKTQEELKKLEAKYSVTDKVGTSFAVLAYVFIGLFILFIVFGDFIKIFEFVSNKLNCKSILSNKNFVPYLKRQSKFSTDKPVDPAKLRDLDERIFKFQVEYKKAYHKKFLKS